LSLLIKNTFGNIGSYSKWVLAVFLQFMLSLTLRLCGNQFAVCSLQFAVCGLQFAVCSLQFSVFSLQFAVSSLQLAVRS